MNAVGNVRDLADLVGKLLQQIGEDEQSLAQAKLALDDQIAAIAQQDGQIEIGEQAHAGLEQADLVEDRSLVILHGAVGGAELFDLALLPGEAFDDLHAPGVFSHKVRII